MYGTQPTLNIWYVCECVIDLVAPCCLLCGNTDANAHTFTRTHTHYRICSVRYTVSVILLSHDLLVPLAFVVGKRLILLRANYVKMFFLN